MAHDFPARLLRLALYMYASTRRLRWLGAMSLAAQAHHGVVAGCLFAMFFVQLAMLTPMDQFVQRKQSVSYALEIYADDLGLLVWGAHRMGTPSGL